MKDLNYQLSKFCRDNRDGGFSTQAVFVFVYEHDYDPEHEYKDGLVVHWDGDDHNDGQ